jgi:hypothetical protein
VETLPKENNNKSPIVRKPVSWMQLGVAAVFAAILAGAIHYSLTYQHQNAFEDERAFRVLDELVVQIRNLETSRATFLNSLPPVIKRLTPRCTDPDLKIRRLDSLKPEVTEAHYTGYVDHLDFANTKLCVIDKQSVTKDIGHSTALRSEENAKPNAESKSATSEGHSATMQAAPPPPSEDASKLTDLADSMCHGLYADSVVFGMSAKDDLLATVSCGDSNNDKFVLQESLERAVSKFISQDFFDESILTFANGMVIGEFPVQSTNISSNAVALHRAIADRLNLISAKGALYPPQAGDDSQSAKQKGSSETPTSSATPTETQSNHLEPFAWTTKIAEQQYRVSVLPFNAPYSVAFTSDQKSCKKDQETGKTNQGCDKKNPEHLYMIGLHRIDWSRDIQHALWPSGFWAAVLLLSLNLVAWPLISLTFGRAEESVSVGRALGCVAGLILIPVLLVIATASLWSDLELQSWMRTNAREYAHMISAQLRGDLIDGARILTTFRPVYNDPTVPPRCKRGPELSIRPASGQVTLGERCDTYSGTPRTPLFGYDHQKRPVDACVVHEPLDDDRCDDVLLLPARQAPADGRWSPIRSILAVNVNGDRFGPAMSPFSTVTVSPKAKIPDREYFQALKAGQGWMLDTPPSAPLEMVAQRLYNRGDASKALQLAVPLCDPPDAFCGIITGDIRMYGLTSPISPPLLKFAVIDTTTGTVIFSSTDTRSLAENFFRESEQDPGLMAVIKSHHEADFVGRYLGEPQRFYYTPISNVPWGVLVFYSRKELADLPFRAGSAALVCYVGLLLAALIALCVIRWLWLLFTATFPRPLDLLEPVWPRLRLPELRLPRWYRDLSRFRPPAWAFLVLLIGMLTSLSTIAIFASALAALVAAACAGSIFKPHEKKGESKRSPAQQYSQCLFTLITVVSVLPAFALFVEFYHLQYEALIRDGLAENAAQTQSRYDAVHEELHRLLPPTPRGGKGSDAWNLTLHPNIGMSDQDNDLPSAVQIQLRKGTMQPLQARNPNLHQQLVWQWTASSPDQQRRLAIITEPATTRGLEDMQCGLDEKSRKDTCRVRMSDGSQLEVQSRAQLRGAFRANEFEWNWLRILAIVAAVLFAAMGTSFLCWLVTTRLVGLTDELKRLSNVKPDAGAGGRSFDDQWKDLSEPERLALYQIARGDLINPRNLAVLEKPMREGLVVLDPFPVLSPSDLKDSILRRESESDLERLQREAGDSPWRTIRGPLFIVIMVVIAWLSWAAGGSMKALMAVLVATAAFLGQIVQLVNFARGGGTVPKESS